MVRTFKIQTRLSFLFLRIFLLGAFFLINGCGLQQPAGYLGFDVPGSDPELGGVYGPTQTNDPIEGTHPDAGAVIGRIPAETAFDEPPSAPRRYSYSDAQLYSPPLLDPGG